MRCETPNPSRGESFEEPGFVIKAADPDVIVIGGGPAGATVAVLGAGTMGLLTVAALRALTAATVVVGVGAGPEIASGFFE